MQNMNGLELFFMACAFIGGLFFVIWLILQFIGMGDVDTDAPGDLDAMGADASFRLLSLQGLTAFSMMFGLVGFGLYRQTQMHVIIAIIGGTAAGFITVWIISRIFTMLMKLQSSGTLDNKAAIGCSGTVYLTIPAEGTGSVQITMQNRLREYDAVSFTGEELPTGIPIRVVRVNGNVLVVERLTQ